MKRELFLLIFSFGVESEGNFDDTFFGNVSSVYDTVSDGGVASDRVDPIIQQV